ncbi:MAG: protein-disulfide reductase DsbD domain-containing protein, partial [Pseudomonadota bacterium]
MLIHSTRGKFLGRAKGLKTSRLFPMAMVLFISLSLVMPNLVSPSPARAATVQVEVVHSRDGYEVGKSHALLFRLKTSHPWYIHSTKTDEAGFIPTVLSFQDRPGLRLESLRFPAPEVKKFDYTEQAVEVYSGDVLVEATLVVTKEAFNGKQEITGELTYQACSSKACLPPERV